MAAKLSSVKNNTALSHSSAVGGVQIGFGILFAIPAFFMLIGVLVAGFAHEYAPAGYFVLSFSFILASVWLLVCGARRLSLGDRFRKLTFRLSTVSYTVSDLSGLLGRTYSDLLSDISLMKRRSFWRGVTVLDDCIIIQPWDANVTYKIMADEGMTFSEGKKRANLPYVVVLTILVAAAFILPLPFGNFIWVVAAVIGSIPLQRLSFLINVPQPAVLYKKVAPATMKIVPIELELSGNGEADGLIEVGQRYIGELQALNIAIKDEYLSQRIALITTGTKQLMGFLRQNPDKHRQVRQLMDYSLPTTIKLLHKYDELSRQPVKGDNINESMNRIREMSDMVAQTFRRELDALYKDQSLDIEVDIEVMKNMMQQSSLEMTMSKVAEDFHFTSTRQQ